MSILPQPTTGPAPSKRAASKRFNDLHKRWPILNWIIAAIGSLLIVIAIDGVLVSHRQLALGLFLLSVGGAIFAWLRMSYRDAANRQSVASLNKLVAEIRASEAPIDSLTKTTGLLKPLAEEIGRVFHDLRSQKRAIAELHQEINQRVANRTSALESLVGSLKHQATQDALTKLFNRRMLDEILPALVNQCLGDESTLAILMIDVDYFKVLNDSLGHAAGDELLRALGKIIQGSIRPHDAAFRYGGDEFVVLLPDCDVVGANHVADRVRALVNALVKTYKIPQPPRVSIGQCTLSELPEPTAQNLLKRADEALYKVKADRRRASAA